MANETYNILQGIFNGQTPIQRSNPMSGQSNYYYMKPNQNSYTPLSQMQTVDVPSATTPNPYLREEERVISANPVEKGIALIQDGITALKYYKEMNETNKKLIDMYGKGAANGTDNYYHALLQCDLAQKGDLHLQNGLALGYGKEAFDFVRKNNRPWTEVSADAIKDLTNNRYGSKVGYSDKTANCRDLLGNLRTGNMINAGIK